MKEQLTFFAPESENNDTLFVEQVTRHTSNLSNNTEYKRPAISIWYYTNIKDLTVWIDHEGMPSQVPFSRNMFPRTKGYKPGVYIVKTYNLRRELYGSLYVVHNILNSNKLNLSTEMKDEVIAYCDNVSRNIHYDTTPSLRFVDYIPEENIREQQHVKNGTYTLAKNINDLYEETHQTVSTEEPVVFNDKSYSGLTFSLDFVSSTSDNKKFFIGDKLVTAQCKRSVSGSYVCIRIRSNAGGLISQTRVYEDEFDALGIIHGTKSGSDRTFSNEKFLNSSIKFSDAIVKSQGERLKLLADVEVSFHKLEAFALNTHAAELKLNKENTTLFREVIKTVGGLL